MEYRVKASLSIERERKVTPFSSCTFPPLLRKEEGPPRREKIALLTPFEVV